MREREEGGDVERMKAGKELCGERNGIGMGKKGLWTGEGSRKDHTNRVGWPRDSGWKTAPVGLSEGLDESAEVLLEGI